MGTAHHDGTDNIERNVSSAFDQFSGTPSAAEDRAMYWQLIGGAIGLMFVLAIVGWALARVELFW